MATSVVRAPVRCNARLSKTPRRNQQHNDPQVPTLSQVIAVSRATFLMGDHSRPAEKAATQM